MSAAVHTPKPWLALGDEVYGADGARVAEAVAKRDMALVLAAPDLLEALLMVRDADNDCRSDGLPMIPSMARAKIDAAIAKAQGQA